MLKENFNELSAIKALAAVNNAIIQLMVYGVPSLNRG